MKIPAPSESTPDFLSQSNGRLALSESPLSWQTNPLAIKLPITNGVIGASVPPAIAISASPKRIIAAASATPSSPEGHAEVTVAAFAQAPIRSATTLAGACGIDATDVVGATRLGPVSRTA